MTDKILTTYLPTFLFIAIPLIGSWIMGFIAGKAYENHKINKLIDKKILEYGQQRYNKG